MIDEITLSPLEITMRIIGAIVASALIGYERERKGHEAGIRTHTLVAVGSCIFAIIQVKTAFKAIELSGIKEHLESAISIDMTRIVAQVVSGVGFLGAGTIIISKRRVRGLTTAASIWTTAAIGVGFGMGYFFTTALSTVVVLITLVIFKKLFKSPIPLTFEVAYLEQPNLSKKIKEYIHMNKIPLLSDHYYYELKEGIIYHKNYYTIDTNEIESKSEFFDGLFHIGEIQMIRSIYDEES